MLRAPSKTEFEVVPALHRKLVDLVVCRSITLESEVLVFIAEQKA